MLKYQNSLVKRNKSQPFSNSRIVNKQLIFGWIKMHNLKLSFVLSWKILNNLKLHSFMYQKTAVTFAGFVVDDPVGTYSCYYHSRSRIYLLTSKCSYWFCYSSRQNMLHYNHYVSLFPLHFLNRRWKALFHLLQHYTFTSTYKYMCG